MHLFIMVVVGVVLIARGLKLLSRGKDSLDWETTTGVITSHDQIKDKGDSRREGTLSRYALRYTYEHNGKQFSNDRVGFKWTNRHSKELQSKYPTSSEVTVFISPKDPRNSVLEPGVDHSNYIAIIAGFFFAFVGSGIITIMAWPPQ